MRIFVPTAALVAAFLVACSSGSDATPEATSTPTGSPSATATAAAPTPTSTTPAGVETEASYVAVVDLDTGEATVIQDGPGTWNSWFEASGDVVNALVLGTGAPPRTVRVGLDGGVLLDSDTELQVRVSADGTARAYGGPADGGLFQTYLEVDGELVALEGEPTVLPIGFSPSGDRLLSYAGAAAAEGEAAITYSVHDLDGTLLTSFVNRVLATSTSVSPTTWSPSGQFVATMGLDGLVAHDAAGGESYTVLTNGSTAWSPIEDALLVVAGPNEVQIIRFPDLESVSLEVSTAAVAASFDPTGRVVAVSDATRGLTTIFDAITGEQLRELGGVAEAFLTPGFDPVVMTDDGVAALLTEAPSCGGTLVVHPTLGDRGQCLSGNNARWAPDASAVSYMRGAEIVVFDIDTAAEQVVASDVPTAGSGTLARWNEGGTHLLLEWPWGGGGWTDSLP